MSKIEKTEKTVKPESSIFSDYIQITSEYKKKYGEHTILLMQVGAFFEVYGFKLADGSIEESQINDFSQICNLNISDKKVAFGSRNVLMAGFRDYTLDRYLQKLTESGYTVIVYVQEKLESGLGFRRVLDSIHSAGTYVSCETDNSAQMTNNIMCIWLDVFKPVLNSSRSKPSITKMRDTFVCGIAIANMYTGKSVISEFQTPFLLNPTTFDELERCVSVHSPSEVIIISDLDDSTISSIIQFTGLVRPTIHRVNSIQSEKAVNCAQQKYIQHILATFYGEDAHDICCEFQIYPTATQAFCYLLDFIQEHNPNLVRNIAIPDFNASNRMILANHTLKQLNILDDSSDDGKGCGNLSSVSTFLNRCSSAMGRRLFQTQLVSPTTDESWLNQEYEMITLFMKPENVCFVDTFRKLLKQVRDIEKLCRQLVLRKIYPASISHLYESLQIIQQMNMCLFESTDICAYLCGRIETPSSPATYIDKMCTTLIKFLDEHLFMDKCKTVLSMNTFEESIIRPFISKDLDDATKLYTNRIESFHAIHSFFNELMRQKDHLKEDTTEYVKIHETEKSGQSLQITKKRGLTLKNILAKSFDLIKIPLSDGTEISFMASDVRFTNAAASIDEIDFTVLTKICKEIMHLKESMNRLITVAYNNFLGKLETSWYNTLENVANYTAKLDVLVCKTYIAQHNNYCCPVIVENAEKSFVNAQDLRHCLIEHLQTNELYVPNDVVLGDGSSDGILLYGTNAVGKTSFIRALGIAVIMAQSGMFVPCSKFTYKPYSAIYSRILGNDNLFKGLSTFAVEMSELRIILKMADNQSLILGDELCSGTETESALSIFVAGLTELHTKNASFVFATHFHEIIRYEEVEALNRLKLKHMAVYYDREIDGLVYDRKLKDGPGNRMYGLEVCKSLHLPDDFLQKAYSIRSKYFPDTKGELSHKSSTYNAKKVRGMCEMCKKEMGTEVHHLQQQMDANEDGFIGSIHKNHPANLMTVCEKCHNSFHKKSPIQNVAILISSTTSESENIQTNNNNTNNIIENTSVIKKKVKTTRRKSTKGYVINTEVEDSD